MAEQVAGDTSLSLSSAAKIRSQQRYMPEDILSLIIEQVFLVGSNLKRCYRLRLVNRYFNEEVLHLLFNQFYIDRVMKTHRHELSADRFTAYRYWYAFISSNNPFRRVYYYSSRNNVISDPMLPYTKKELVWLGWFHDTLRAAADSIAEKQRMDEWVERSMIDPGTCDLLVDNPRNASISAICDAVICIMGAREAWKCIHAKPDPRSITHFSSKMSVNSERGSSLLTQTAEFWELLVTTYQGNLEELTTLLDRVKVKHQDPADWLQRVQSNYSQFSQHCSAAEHEWLEYLAACLKIAVIKDHHEITSFLLKQDLGIGARVFEPMNSKLFSLAIDNRATNVLILFVECGWLEVYLSRDTAHSDRQHNTAMRMILELPETHPKRNIILQQLLTTVPEKQTIRNLEIMLDHVAKNNDINLARTIVSSLRGTLDGSLRSGIRRNADVTQNPLATAVSLGHYDVAHIMLSNSRKLYLASMISESFTGRDFRTQILLDLLKPRDTTDKPNILPDLLRATQRHRVEQIRAIASDHDNTTMFKVFFEHVKLNARASHTDPKTFGEQALCAAIACADPQCAKYLIEHLGVRFRSTRVLPSEEEIGMPSAFKHITRLDPGSGSWRDIRSLLTQYGMELNRGRTVVRLVGTQCRH